MLSVAAADVLERALEGQLASGQVQRDSPGDGRFAYRRGPNIDTAIGWPREP